MEANLLSYKTKKSDHCTKLPCTTCLVCLNVISRQKNRYRKMEVDITEGHFVLLAALLYNERGIAATEDEIRSNILKAVETVQKIPTQKFIIKSVDE